MSQEDAAALLSEFIYQIDNLPAEVAFILEEIGWKDEKLQGELGMGGNAGQQAAVEHTSNTQMYHTLVWTRH